VSPKNAVIGASIGNGVIGTGNMLRNSAGENNIMNIMGTTGPVKLSDLVEIKTSMGRLNSTLGVN
jgi:hypothetical protein